MLPRFGHGQSGEAPEGETKKDKEEEEVKQKKADEKEK